LVGTPTERDPNSLGSREGRPDRPQKKVAPEFSETPPCFNARGYSALRFCAHLGTPLVKAMLDSVDDVGQDHTGDCKDQDADEDLIGLKSCARDGVHEADARSGRIEFAHHNADERTAYCQP